MSWASRTSGSTDFPQSSHAGLAVDPENQGPRSVWVRVMRQPDTTGSWNKHGYNMTFVTCGESGREGKNKRTDHCHARRSPKHPRVHASPTLPWCNHMFHCSRRKSTSELMCARLLVGSRRSQKSRFHVQHHAFLLAFPSDDRGVGGGI